ncbi:discoidin domain-containing protein [Taibaiella soli]|nr:discoidin domain-containing protein [Taibaiella soli]
MKKNKKDTTLLHRKKRFAGSLSLLFVAAMCGTTPARSQLWGYNKAASSISGLPVLSGTIIGTAGSYANLGNDVSKVFDGDVNTFFDGPTADGVWAGLDLGSVKSIYAIRFRPRNGVYDRMRGGMFQISNDANFTNYTTLFTLPGSGVNMVDSFLDYYAKDIQPVGPTQARYIRYLSPSGGWGNVAEVTVYGPAAAPTISWNGNQNLNGFKLVGGSGPADTLGLTITPHGVVLIDSMGFVYDRASGNKYGEYCSDTNHYGNTVPDYVFDQDYSLMSLDKLNEYIKSHKHLPEFKSEKDYGQQGYINVMQFNFLLLRKIEELTLHLIEQHAEKNELMERVEQLESKLNNH